MAQNKQRRFEELKLHMLRSFPDMQNRMDQQINRNELQNILDKMCQKTGGQAYDYDIFEELVEKTENDFQILTPNNFLNVYNEAEEILTLKVEHLQQNTNKHQQNSIYLQDMVSQLNRRQNLTQQQQSQGNFLIIEGIRVNNLRRLGNQPNQVFLNLEIGSFKQETQVVNSNNPEFQFNMKLPVHSFLESFTITVLDKQTDQFSFQPFQYGGIELKVDALPFFSPQTAQYTLMEKGQQVHSQLELTCHLEVNDCQRAISDLKQRNQYFQEKINENVEEIQQFQEQIQSLQQAFKQNADFQSATHNIAPLYQQGSNVQRNSNQQGQFQPNQYNNSYQEQNYPVNHIPQNSQLRNDSYAQPQNSQLRNNSNLQPMQNQNPNDVTNKSLVSEQNFGAIQQNYQQPVQQQQQYEQFQPATQFQQEEQQVFQQQPQQEQQQEFNQQPNYFEQQQYDQQQQQVQPYNQKQMNNPYMDNDEDDIGCDSLLEQIRKSHILTCVLILLGILQSLKRPEFLDILIGTTFIVFIYKRRFNSQNYQQLLTYYIAALALSLVIDILWLIKYVSPWGESQSSVDQGTEGFLRGLVTFLAIVAFIFKIATTGSYYLLRQGSFEEIEKIEILFYEKMRNTFRLNQQSGQYQQFDNENTQGGQQQQDYNNQIRYA